MLDPGLADVSPEVVSEPYGPAAWATGGLVNLVEGAAFSVSGRTGDIHPETSEGLYYLDTRLLSRFELSCDGRPIEPLSVTTPEPFSAVHVARRKPRGGRADAPLVVVRRRFVGSGMRDDVELRNYGHEPLSCRLSVAVASDFADLFAVKEGRAEAGTATAWPTATGLRLAPLDGAPVREVTVDFDPPPDLVEEGRVSWDVALVGGGRWSMCAEVGLVLEGRPIAPSHPCGEPVETSLPTERLERWRRSAPEVSSDVSGLGAALARGAEELGALRIFDPDEPRRVVIAAGAPWFMTLFGRDSILAGWMSLMVDPLLARGVVETLAHLQGTRLDPATDEQPGRILHEVRFGEAASLSLGGGSVYYGSIDSSPLFVMLLGELRRWGLDEEVVRRLQPSVDRVLRWIERYGDRDGDGYVEYQRATPEGLLHQGWKDSWDAIRFADGTLAEPPIALCEVQGYVYAAYRAATAFAVGAGDASRAESYRGRAAELKEAFNRDFWLEDRGWYALALDAEKRPVDALASNVGHCLWTGIVDERRAPEVARRLLAPDMFSGWGVRTMASSMDGYNPVSYHCGSVWPHDTAIAAAGLRRYGLVEESQRLVSALLDLFQASGERFPELVTGFDRQEFPLPVPYPTSCSPQAWSAASPFLLLRTLLGLDPAVPSGRVYLDPALPEDGRRLVVSGIPLAGHRVTIRLDGDDVHVEGLPDELEVVRGRRRP